MEEYQHEPISPNSPEIRLLTLLPGEVDSPVICRLHAVSLDNNPEFEALSYVWGDPTIKRPIGVNGKLFHVTNNLAEALRALRQRRGSKSRALWVDAICINQHDLAEKNIQVPLMGRIYSEASRVVAWLGPSTRDIELAVSYARTYHEKRYASLASIRWLMLDFLSIFSSKWRKERLLSLVSAYRGFLAIETVPYWTRMWTFQEFYLPKDEPICVCGDQQFYETSMRDAGVKLSLKTEEATGWDAVMMTQAGIEYAEVLLISEAWRFLMERPNTQSIRPGQNGGDSESESDMTTLMMYTAMRECTDPRDRVFALYGIASEAAEAFPPDYSKPLEQVYLEATSFIVNNEGYLPFGVFQVGGDGSSDNTYHNPDCLSCSPSPSWALNFGKNNNPEFVANTPPLLPHRIEDFRDAAVSDDMPVLYICGWKLGRVGLVLEFAATPAGVLSQLRDLLTCNLLAGTSTGGLDFGAVARLCLDTDHRNHEVYDHNDVAQAFRSVLEADGPPSHAPYGPSPVETLLGRSDLENLCREGVEIVAGMLLFTITPTQGSHGRDVIFGLGDTRIKDGDFVVAAPQSRVPLVLRATHGTTRGQSEGPPPADIEDDHLTFTLVTMARVDGLMANVAPDEELVECITQRELEDFFIF